VYNVDKICFMMLYAAEMIEGCFRSLEAGGGCLVELELALGEVIDLFDTIRSHNVTNCLWGLDIVATEERSVLVTRIFP
jgi:hypothetical protein